VVLKLYYGEETKFEHEFEQLHEIIKIFETKFSEEDVYILTNVLFSNGDIDCILLTKNGPVILELKDYFGEVIGTENGDWFVRDNDKDVPLNTNLFQQLKGERNDFHKKLEKIRDEHFSRVEPEDLRKINAWGYFREGSTYPENQMNLRQIPWFSVVSKKDLAQKTRHIFSDYTLTIADMDHIVQELNVKEWTENMLELLNSDVSSPVSQNPISISVSPEIAQHSAIGSVDIVKMIKIMAPYGTAPDEGCSLFDIENGKTIDLLTKIYLENSFTTGLSAEKFIVGPYGSGKTHLINQLCDVAKSKNCFTSVVALTKDIDVTSNYYVYKEIVRQISPPSIGSSKRGIKALMDSCLESIEKLTEDQTENPSDAKELLLVYINSIDQEDFESDTFGRVVKKGYNARLKDDFETYDAACRWIGGEFNDKGIAKLLNIAVCTKPELNLTAKMVNLSLYKFIKYSNFAGTVVAFDEAEQGFGISKKKQSTLYSLMQSDINAINKLTNGSVLILYAILSEVKEGMMNFPALQQRISHPIPFPQNPYAPLIEITRPDMISKDGIINELCKIGNKLVDLVYSVPDLNITIPQEDVYRAVQSIALRTYDIDMDISGRRRMVKGICSILASVIDRGILIDPDTVSLEVIYKNGIDDEV